MWNNAQQLPAPHNCVLLVYAEHTHWFAVYTQDDEWKYIDDHAPCIPPSHWQFLTVPEQYKSVCF